jgi:hypothetical protein
MQRQRHGTIQRKRVSSGGAKHQANAGQRRKHTGRAPPVAAVFLRGEQARRVAATVAHLQTCERAQPSKVRRQALQAQACKEARALHHLSSWAGLFDRSGRGLSRRAVVRTCTQRRPACAKVIGNPAVHKARACWVAGQAAPFGDEPTDLGNTKT